MSWILAFAQLALSASLVYFARQTWIVTKQYTKASERSARLVALQLLAVKLEEFLSRSDSAQRRYAEEICKLVLDEFPDLYGRFRPNLPAELRRE